MLYDFLKFTAPNARIEQGLQPTTPADAGGVS